MEAKISFIVSGERVVEDAVDGPPSVRVIYNGVYSISEICVLVAPQLTPHSSHGSDDCSAEGSVPAEVQVDPHAHIRKVCRDALKRPFSHTDAKRGVIVGFRWVKVR